MLRRAGTLVAVVVALLAAPAAASAAAPAVTSVTGPPADSYITGEVLRFFVTWDAPVTVVAAGGGSPTLTVDIGGITRDAVYEAGSGSAVLAFEYFVQAGDSDQDGVAVVELRATGDRIEDGSGNAADLTLHGVASTTNVRVDTEAPWVVTVMVPADGSYDVGEPLDFTVRWTEPVTTDTSGGTPQLALTIGSTTRFATYDFRVGSLDTTFRYVVQAGDMDSDGITIGALHLNGGTIRDMPGNDASLALIAVGATTNVLVDTAPPVVSSVSVPSAATYIAGQTLEFVVVWNKKVEVAGGTPRIALGVGGSTRYAVYAQGSSTDRLTFRYVVGSGDDDWHGVTVGALELGGSTIRDLAGHDAVTTLNSVASTTAVRVDGVAPVVTSVTVPTAGSYPAASVLNFTVAWRDVVEVDTSGGTPRIAIYVGSNQRYATYASTTYVGGYDMSQLTFSYVVQFGETDTDGIVVGALSTNGGTIRDLAGNDATMVLNSVGDTSRVLVDTTPPEVSSVSVPAAGMYGVGQALDFTVSWSEIVLPDTSGGTPRIALTIGGVTRYAAFHEGFRTEQTTFRYVVQPGDMDVDGITVGTLVANGGTIRDRAGHDAIRTLHSVGSTAAVLVDGVAPVLGSVTVPDPALYGVGQNLDFVVTWDDDVVVDTTGGAPRLALTVGAATRYATYRLGSGTDQLTFRYVVQSGDVDSDGIAVASLQTSGGTIRDAAGNDADVDLRSVGATSGVVIDAIEPSIVRVSVPAAGNYLPGQRLELEIEWSKPVFVDAAGGSPRIALAIGSLTRYATYSAGSGTTTHRYGYAVAEDDLDGDGIVVGALEANGAALRDALGNGAALVLAGAPSTSAVLVGVRSSAPPVPSSAKLTVVVRGSGVGHVRSAPSGFECARGTCAAQFDVGTSVTLSAAAAPGSSFAGWSPAVCAAAITITSDTTCTATFTASAPKATKGNDLIRLGLGAQTFRAMAGNDRVYGGAGNDTLYGDAGNDALYGEAGNDRLSGGVGNDRLYGGPGNDRIDSGAGRDVIVGGAGNDVIVAAYGGRTRISCGPGRDTVLADRFDVVARDCEVVRRASA